MWCCLTGSLDELGDEIDPDKEFEKMLLAHPPLNEKVDCEEVDCRICKRQVEGWVDDHPVFFPMQLPSGKFLTCSGFKYLNERGALCVASPQPEWTSGQKVYQAPFYHEVQRHFPHLPPWAPDKDWPSHNIDHESREVVRSVEKKESQKERRKRLLKKQIWEQYDRWREEANEWIGKLQWLSV